MLLRAINRSPDLEGGCVLRAGDVCRRRASYCGMSKHAVKQVVDRPLPESVDVHVAPEESAKAAGLRYVSDAKPGIKRETFKDEFRYRKPDSSVVTEDEVLGRIKALVIPPAWTKVWISTHANGHLQATGRDARGRKQSRYHSKWREVRDENKYERMTHFAEALPLIRARVKHDLGLHGLPREKVLATIVSLMETTHIRVGNAEYAKENHSYGLTTMQDKHVDVQGAEIKFHFQGKSRVEHTISLHDKRLARIIRQCEELPGHELFQFLDHEGNHHVIDSQAVNDYLREVTGQHFTAKDFRTWAGTVLAAQLLQGFDPFTSASQAKKNIVDAIKQVASQLGNTPSVCRKCYVHPAVLEAYMGGTSVKEAKREVDREIAKHEHALRDEEQSLMNLLAERLVLEVAM